MLLTISGDGEAGVEARKARQFVSINNDHSNFPSYRLSFSVYLLQVLGINLRRAALLARPTLSTPVACKSQEP